jgi:hypothetical protein
MNLENTLVSCLIYYFHTLFHTPSSLYPFPDFEPHPLSLHSYTNIAVGWVFRLSRPDTVYNYPVRGSSNYVDHMLWRSIPGYSASQCIYGFRSVLQINSPIVSQTSSSSYLWNRDMVCLLKAGTEMVQVSIKCQCKSYTSFPPEVVYPNPILQN